MDKKVFPFATNIRSTATNTTESQPTWEEKYFKQLSQREDNTDDVNDSIMTSKNIVSEIPLDEIALSPFQTREISSSDDLEELKNSILSKGIIQPIIVRELGSSSQSDAKYELVAGERRLRATKQAGLNSIPAIVYDLNDQESLELSIIENAQRENLNPIEEAQAYKMLGDKFHLNQSEIAKVVGKNRVSIANSLRLLSLEIEIIELLKSGELTAGHGRALLMVDEPEIQLSLARLAIKKALSVRALEALVSKADQLGPEIEEEDLEEQEKLNQSLKRLEEKILTYLGIEKAKLSTDSEGKKRLSLSFDTEASWKRFISKIKD